MENSDIICYDISYALPCAGIISGKKGGRNMQTIIIGILVIVVPMIAYCVGTVMRDDMYAKEADGEAAAAKDNKNVKVTKDTKMGQILAMDKGMGDFLMQAGLHCVTCASSTSESLEVACTVHGLNVDQKVTSINAYLAEENE